jgi:hypothetical protein
MISKLMRLYKRSHGLRQICNIAVYILHTACTIHLLNLPNKNARRDITHGVKHLEEIAEGWLCARRTLAILNILARKWNVDLPEDASSVLQRTNNKYGAWGVEAPKTPTQRQESMSPIAMSPTHAIFQPPTANYNSQMHNPAGGLLQATRRPSGNTSLPPQTVADMQARLMQTSPAHTTQQGTPVSRTSVDSNSHMTPAGNSPSALFGGVDQLLRDSQDWWLRDQSQLAMGFEQWPMDWGLASPPTFTGLNGSAGQQQGTNGYSPVNSGGYAGLNGNGNINGGGGQGFGNGIQQYPDEHQWYS